MSSNIPNAFGGFAPFPNTIMIPTMGLQSDVIGFRFGFGYEKGKRTLRAMSNEQFNTLNEEAEQAIYKEHDTTAINFFKMEMIRWVELQTIIIEKSVEIETMKAQRTPSAMREIFEGFTSGFGQQQKEDAKNFFASLKDPIMSLMAWFSGHRADPDKIDKSIIKINPLTGLPWGVPSPTNPVTPQPTFTPKTFTPTRTDLNIDAPDAHRHTAEHHITKSPIPLFRQRPIGIPSKIYTFRTRLTKGAIENMLQGHKNMLAQMNAALKNPKTPTSNKRNIINFIPWVRFNITETARAIIQYQRTNAYA